MAKRAPRLTVTGAALAVALLLCTPRTGEATYWGSSYWAWYGPQLSQGYYYGDPFYPWMYYPWLYGQFACGPCGFGSNAGQMPAGSFVVGGNAPAYSTAATLEVIVPENAEVWLDGKKMPQTGTVRRFPTPQLASDQVLTQELRVTWKGKEGKETTEQRKVQLQAAQQLIINMMP